MNGWKKNSMTGLLVGLVMFLAATTAAALSCIDANTESVTYEVAEIRVDGQVAEGTEFDERATAHGEYDEGLRFVVDSGTANALLVFSGGAP